MEVTLSMVVSYTIRKPMVQKSFTCTTHFLPHPKISNVYWQAASATLKTEVEPSVMRCYYSQLQLSWNLKSVCHPSVNLSICLFNVFDQTTQAYAFIPATLKTEVELSSMNLLLLSYLVPNSVFSLSKIWKIIALYYSFHTLYKWR